MKTKFTKTFNRKLSKKINNIFYKKKKYILIILLYFINFNFQQKRLNNSSINSIHLAISIDTN